MSENLSWSDVISPTWNPDECFEKYREKEEILQIYSEYTPQTNIIEKIRNIISQNDEKIKIFVIGAFWCPDSKNNVPKMSKIVEIVGNIEYTILYGLKVNKFEKEGNTQWDRRSPPEANNPKFDLKKIPTFYIFNKDGKFINKIVEHPRKNSTLEEDLAFYLEEFFKK